MSSIYLHIPFCHAKCHYCNFFSLAAKRGINDFAATICREAFLRSGYVEDQQVRTIYFGGGTPSMLPAGETEKILNCIRKYFHVSSDAEITLEANPEDITPDKLSAFVGMGINRLSIGVQSFCDSDLQYLNRVHDARQSIVAIELALKSGFQNLSVDLIFGIPTLTMKAWKENLKKVHSYRIPHLSAYALTVEPNTILHWQIAKKRVGNIVDEAQASQFMELMKWADKEGYQHYEISNLCLPGMESKHNSGYWSGKHYLGLGPSAHSFNGHSRQWNMANLQKYIEGIKKDMPKFELEILTPSDLHNEYLMTSLRTSKGIDLDYFMKRFGDAALNELIRSLQPFLAQNLVVQNQLSIFLTRQGKLFADHITAALFCERT